MRSIGQGALAVDFALYLRAFDWPAAAISACWARVMVEQCDRSQ
jgi:hypothetical protein